MAVIGQGASAMKENMYGEENKDDFKGYLAGCKGGSGA